MLVVTEVVSIDSEKVTEMLSLIETSLWLSDGEIEETVGAGKEYLERREKKQIEVISRISSLIT